uniref:Uncharacterized protein n=1 Tax=Octopus bimaculoides TaxID=37653 RepID=A0A0L8FY39_OCTBM
MNKNITGLKHLEKHYLLAECNKKCNQNNNCDCFYYQQFNDSCSLLNSNDCTNILNSTLPGINDASTILAIFRDRNSKIKRSNDYQKISNSVKNPNIMFRTWNHWYCENLCSWSLNCCGYFYKYGGCQLLIMNDCYNSPKVLLSDGNFIDLRTPIKCKRLVFC